MTATLLTFHAEEHSIQALDLIVNTTAQSRQNHLNRALTRYINYELAHLQAIAEGIIDAEWGHLISLENVQAKFNARSKRNG